MTPEICPNCGATVPAKAKACPQCGSDETTGWSEEASANGLDLPDENFNYDAYVEQEFGSKKPVPRGMHWFWWVVAIILVAVFLAFWFR
jgi:uncharacterized membrane protein YvbJ